MGTKRFIVEVPEEMNAIVIGDNLPWYQPTTAELLQEMLGMRAECTKEDRAKKPYGSIMGLYFSPADQKSIKVTEVKKGGGYGE